MFGCPQLVAIQGRECAAAQRRFHLSNPSDFADEPGVDAGAAGQFTHPHAQLQAVFDEQQVIRMRPLQPAADVLFHRCCVRFRAAHVQ